jgi:hypothetical protein
MLRIKGAIMRNPLKVITIACLTLAAQSADARGNSGKGPSSVNIGFGSFPMQVSGLEDVHVSDWETHPGADEGRLALPLGAYNTEGAGLMPAVKLGLGFGKGPVQGIFELYAGGVSNLGGGALLIGGDLRMEKGQFVLGVPLRVGAVFGTISLGDAKIIDGFTPPVLLDAGAINEGDPLNATITGIMASVGVLGEFWLTKKFAIRAEAQVQQGSFSAFSIAAGEDDSETQEVDERVHVQGSDASVVKTTNGSREQSGMQPGGGTFGVSGFVGVSLRL